MYFFDLVKWNQNMTLPLKQTEKAMCVYIYIDSFT